MRQFYAETTKAVLEFFKTDGNAGLTTDQVTAARVEYGMNQIPPPKGKSALVRFLLQIHQPLIYVLILSATIALFLGEYVDAAVIYGVVIGNAIMGFFQEDKALKDLSKLTQTIGITMFNTYRRRSWCRGMLFYCIRETRCRRISD